MVLVDAVKYLFGFTNGGSSWLWHVVLSVRLSLESSIPKGERTDMYFLES
jgi:hypothetical protein